MSTLTRPAVGLPPDPGHPCIFKKMNFKVFYKFVKASVARQARRANVALG
jgi:hypothetical protein